VHSLKDVPMELDAPFALPAMLTRHDPADGFVSNLYASLDALPIGARVGTSSLRRQAQLRALRPDLELLDLRGNVNTRLAKLDNGGYGAVVLAVAGLGVWVWASASSRACNRRSGCQPRRRARWRWSATVAIRSDGVVRPLDDAHPRLRGSRAGDEPRAAWQLPRAGGGHRAVAGQ
jgi:hypothetical protein